MLFHNSSKIESLFREEDLNTDAKLSILKSFIKPIELDKISVLGYRDSVFE